MGNNEKLTLKIAQRHVQGEGIDLATFARVELPALEFLAGKISDFTFMREIDYRHAEVLATACGDLVLDGLTTLDDESARILGEKHNGSLSMQGLAALSKVAAKHLSGHQGLINGVKPGAFVTQMRTRGSRAGSHGQTTEANTRNEAASAGALDTPSGIGGGQQTASGTGEGPACDDQFLKECEEMGKAAGAEIARSLDCEFRKQVRKGIAMAVTLQVVNMLTNLGISILFSNWLRGRIQPEQAAGWFRGSADGSAALLVRAVQKLFGEPVDLVWQGHASFGYKPCFYLAAVFTVLSLLISIYNLARVRQSVEQKLRAEWDAAASALAEGK